MPPPILSPPPLEIEPPIAAPLPESKSLDSPPAFDALLPAAAPPPGDALASQPAEQFSAPPLPEFNSPCEPVAPPPQPPLEPEPPAPVNEPVIEPGPIPAPPPPVAPPVDEEGLRKRITEELCKDLEKDRAKAEEELQAWLESEKSRAAATAQAEAQSQARTEVSRILSVERALAQENLQEAIVRERLTTEDARRRTDLFAKQLEAREADLQKQDAFYREQVARLEQRSAQFYKVTTENFHKAADEVNAKYKRYDIQPVCADLQGQILACYRENVGKTLNCSNIASLYLQCVNEAKQQNKLRTGG